MRYGATFRFLLLAGMASVFTLFCLFASLAAHAAMEESDFRAARLLDNAVKNEQQRPYRNIYKTTELGGQELSGVHAFSVPAGCVSNPLPATPASPNHILNADWTSSERAKATIWRQPCQNDPTKSAVLMRVVPTNEPFLCSVAFGVLQGGVPYDSVKITKTAGGGSFCDDLLTTTTFLLDQWSFDTHFDEDAAFQLIYDGFDYQSSVNIPAYSSIETGDPSRAGERVIVEGYIYSDSTPLCAMVIANGQNTFSCDPPGAFKLPNVPLDQNGEVEVQIFASGFAPIKQKYVPEDAGSLTSLPNIYMKRVENGRPLEIDVTYTRAPIEGYVNVTGTVKSNGEPACALFLSNGQSMFTCGENHGKILLNMCPINFIATTPYLTTQVFADGHVPSRADHFMASTCIDTRRNCDPGACIPRCPPNSECCTEGNGGTDVPIDDGGTDVPIDDGGTDVPIDRDYCIHFGAAERGKHCGSPNSLALKPTNTCDVDVSLHYCLEKTGGDWSCGSISKFGPDEESYGAWTCSATGNYKWKACDPEGPSCKFRL
jgi:hypothetical protein